jgi:hypothetical protein
LEQSAAAILLCCGPGLDEQSPALVLNLLYQKARQQFRADEYKIPHHRQYLFVIRKI